MWDEAGKIGKPKLGGPCLQVSYFAWDLRIIHDTPVPCLRS